MLHLTRTSHVILLLHLEQCKTILLSLHPDLTCRCLYGFQIFVDYVYLEHCPSHKLCQKRGRGPYN